MEDPKVQPLNGRNLWPLYLSMAFISMSVLILEISFTRIFSLVFQYHYVFLLISLAILGLGAGGIYVHKRFEKWAALSYEKILPAASGLMALSTIGVTLSITKIPGVNQILIAALLAFLPFFFAGIFISASFRLFGEKSPQLYAADLIGASLGAILVIPLLRQGGINTNLFVAFIGSLPMGFLMHWKFFDKYRKMIAYAVITGLFALSLGNAFTRFLGEIPLGKGAHKEMVHLLAHPGSKVKVVDFRWSAFGRTDLVEDENNPNETALFVDGTAGTTMYRFNGDLKNSSLDGLTQFPGYFPFDLLPATEKEKILVIGSGGGREVLVALVGGAKEITAVEVNGDLVDLVKKYSHFNGGIYNGYPGVKVVVEEGRNFVRRTNENFDIIMLSIPVTKTSRSPEGFALTENFLFTVESINDYLDHLNPNGRLVIVAHQDIEVFRLAFTALAALRKRGIETTSAMKYMYTVGPEAFPILVLKKSPLTPAEAQRVHLNMHKNGYSSLASFIPYIPQVKHAISLGEGIYSEHEMLNQALYLMAEGAVTPEQLIQRANLDIRWVTDEDPFFYKFELGMPSVIVLLLASSLIAAILVWFIRPKNNGEGNKLKNPILFFFLFSFLGIGFMVIEVPLIQKFILFLGQPVYAMAALLFSLLIGAGIGSWVSGSFWNQKTLSKLRFSSLIVAIVAGLYVLFLGKILNIFLGSPFPLRVLISFLLLSPLGFFMGMPFPLGIKLLKSMGLDSHIPKMWGANGICSVLGSVLAIAMAINYGFSNALIFGAILYFTIFILFAFLFRSTSNQDPSRDGSITVMDLEMISAD